MSARTRPTAVMSGGVPTVEPGKADHEIIHGKKWHEVRDTRPPEDTECKGAPLVTPEINAVLDTLVESGGCSKAAARNIRLAMQAGDALGKRRTNTLLASGMALAVPIFAGLAFSPLPNAFRAAGAGWAVCLTVLAIIFAERKL